jgi:hypothetical protein
MFVCTSTSKAVHCNINSYFISNHTDIYMRVHNGNVTVEAGEYERILADLLVVMYEEKTER